MQQPETPSPPNSREALLTVMLTTMAAAFLLFALIVVTGGLVIYLLAVVAGLAAFAGLHYLLWGRLLSERTAGEREEERLREQAKADGWPLPEPRRGGR